MEIQPGKVATHPIVCRLCVDTQRWPWTLASLISFADREGSKPSGSQTVSPGKGSAHVHSHFCKFTGLLLSAGFISCFCGVTPSNGAFIVTRSQCSNTARSHPVPGNCHIFYKGSVDSTRPGRASKSKRSPEMGLGHKLFTLALSLEHEPGALCARKENPLIYSCPCT